MKRYSIFNFSAIAICGALLAACGGTAEEEPEQEPVEEVIPLADACPDRVQDMRGSTDAITCSCSTETAEAGTVWGAGPYSDDSAVCRAAMHAGLVGDEPANVTINFMDGRDSYTASEANGVETRRWGSWGGSFAFEGAALGEPQDDVAALAACPSNARELRGTAETVKCSCSAQATVGGTVWGSETYTDDSGVCRAAVHAGVITADGGDVAFNIVGGQQSYAGSEANGVESRDYGNWSGSFEFETES